MIHQHILASPRPGMTEAAFQDYWLNIHAVQYASKIAEIRRYKVDLRVDWSGAPGAALWSGMAEIWIANEAEQLASLQSKPFLEGARLDEPRWAAFWNTQVLDTDQAVIHDTMGEVAPAGGVKLMALVKRTNGLSVDDFRMRLRDAAVPQAAAIPGLLRHDVCTTRDGWYVVGEPRFDAAVHFWFESREALEAATTAMAGRGGILPSDPTLVEPRYVFPIALQEHWVIGPAARPYVPAAA